MLLTICGDGADNALLSDDDASIALLSDDDANIALLSGSQRNPSTLRDGCYRDCCLCRHHRFPQLHLQSRPSREHGNDSSLRTESHCHCISYALQHAEFEHVPLSHVYDMNRRVVINVCRLRLPCCKQVPRKYFQVNSSKAQHRQHPFLPL